MTDGLTFNTLRGGNRARLPEFKNKHGVPAHSKPDGSDWNPAQWLQALVGELGEFARVRSEYEAGLLPFSEYKDLAAKELADVQVYLDLLCLRALDQVPLAQQVEEFDAAQCLQQVVMHLGEYANARKKFDRGESTPQDFIPSAKQKLYQLGFACRDLLEAQEEVVQPNRVVLVDEQGIDLGQATMNKFNEVSARVGSRVWVDAVDWHLKEEGA